MKPMKARAVPSRLNVWVRINDRSSFRRESFPGPKGHLEKDLMASVCLVPLQKSDPHGHSRHICMDRSPKANQGTNTLPIFPPDES